jgi:WD40 repeat protein/transcriptional regulator with XRE-family HTH domain
MTGQDMDKRWTSVSDVQTIRQFGATLTEVRERAGLSVRQIAQLVGAPRTTVGDYFAGRSVPTAATAGVLRKILIACGVTEADLLDAWEFALVRVRRAPGPAPADAPQPYRSLAPFQPADAEWFHGRDRLVADLVAHAQLCRGLPLFVLGQSGAGKSSLLRAGVIPALSRDGWQVVLGTPGSLVLPPPCERLLVVVDQFEELFTSAFPPPEFVDDLVALAAVPGVAVLCGMRADFYDRAIGYPELAAALQQENAVVGAMSTDELRSAIVLPARRAGVDIEDGLVELLLRDFRPADSAGGGALPLLSHALHATWSAGARRRMTIEGYLSTGGVAHAVRQSADAAYLALSPEGRRLAQSLLVRLVHVGDGVADTRRRVARDDIPPEYADVLNQFVAERLITVDSGTVSISHEALVYAWPRLREWLDVDRDALRAHLRLQNAALAWTESGRDPSGLYRGTLLTTAENLAERVELTEAEREFVNAGLAERQREEQDRRRQLARLRRWVAALVAAVLVAAGLVVVVVGQRADAVAATDIAVSRQTALRADTLRSSDPALAAQLSLAAYRIAPTPEARSSLLESGHTPFASRALGSDGTVAVAVSPNGALLATSGADGTTRLWRVGDNRRLSAEGEPFSGGPGSVFAAAISPSNRVLALAGVNHGLVLWDISDIRHPARLPAPQPEPTGTGYAAAFSPDGRYLAVTGQSGLWMWQVGPDDVPAKLLLTSQLGGDGKAVAFSDDSTQLAAGGLSGKVHLWQLNGSTVTAGLVRTLSAAVNGVAFHPDGRTLAVAGKDRAVHLLALDGTGETALPGLDGPVYSVQYSDDGQYLAAGLSNSDTLVWWLPERSTPQVLPHPGPVTATYFLPGSRNLVTASADGHARLWSLPGGRLVGHPGPISTVAFGPDNKALAVSASSAGTGPGTVSWSTLSPPPRPIGTAVAEVKLSGASALSRDGTLLATGNTDGTTQLWRVNDLTRPATLLATLTGPDKLIESVAFSPSGTLLATGSDDHRVHLWDVTSPEAPHLLNTMTEPTNLVMSVTFSPNGRSLAATSVDTHTYLWDITQPSSPKPAQRLSGHSNYAYAAAFSPDGKLLAIGSADKTVTLWNVENPAAPRALGKPLVGPTNYVYSVAFTAEGAMLAAVSTDGSVWLWNVTAPVHPTVHATVRTEKSLYSLAISSDGATVAGGDAEGTAHLWPLDAEAVAARICADMGEAITHGEWAQFIPDLAYRPLCG